MEYSQNNNLNKALHLIYNHSKKDYQSRFPNKLGLLRTQYFLNLLGNPQEKIKVIHVAGTAGKGSTAYMVSKLLNGLGFKVGLHLSPNLLDIRECFQINNKLISPVELLTLIKEIIPKIRQMEESVHGIPTYFELLTVLTFYVLWKKKVDYAVIETGLGGLYDATNCVNNSSKMVILTKIYKSHTGILGKGFSQSASQFVGIIQKHNLVISAQQDKNVQSVLKNRVVNQNTSINYLYQQIKLRNIKLTVNGTAFDYGFDSYFFKKIKIKLHGKHQAENASLAIAAVIQLSQRDCFNIRPIVIHDILKSISLKGRFEFISLGRKIVILDGASNFLKMKTLMNTLKDIFPQHKFTFLLAFKKGGDTSQMLDNILSLASFIFLTSFGTKGKSLYHEAEPTTDIERILSRACFYHYRIIQNPDRALREALLETKDILVITGSLYLTVEVYKNKIG